MGRSPCCEKDHTNKGAWTKEEDDKLISYIKSHGEGCWRSLPRLAGLLRCGKSCRLRWINYLRPDLKRGNFTLDEDDLIIKLHSLLGNKWSLIATRLPGRTDNEIKNYWNTHVKRKLLRSGIDPATHRPINETKTLPDSTESRKTEDSLVKILSFGPRLEKKENFGEERYQKGLICKKERVEYSAVEERSVDLNLELRISPPWQDQLHDETNLRFGREKYPCTTCRFGLGNGKECSCDAVKSLKRQTEESSSSCSYSSSDISSSIGYDFLGLNTRVLDFTTLEMN